MQQILSLDPYIVPGNMGLEPPGGLGVVYSLDPFIHSPPPTGGLGSVVSLDPFMYTGSRLGELGEHPWMKSGQCENFAKLVDTYTRLSKKTDKSKETREEAARLAQENEQLYNQCVEKKATSVVQNVLAPTTPAPAAVSTAPAQAYPVAVSGQPVAVNALAQGAPAGQAAGQGWFTAKNVMIAGALAAAAAFAVYYVVTRKKR